MSDTFKFVQSQPFTLAGAGAIIGATTVILSSMAGIDGALLTMTDFGSKGFMTLEPDSGTQEEQISFTGITQNGNGTATLTGVKTVLFISPYTETSGLAKTHAGGVSAIVSNTAGFYNQIAAKGNDETITGLWNFPNDASTPSIGLTYVAPTLDLQIATKKYVDVQVVSGAPDANTTTKGIVQIATQAQYDARTATGSTGASLSPTPALTRTVLTHDFIASATGTDAYAITCTPSVGAYTTGDVYYFKADVANTGACTLAVNGLAAKSLKINGTLTPIDNYIGAGSCVICQYDGTNMQILSVSAKPSVSQDGSEIYIDTTGSANAYVATMIPAVAAYVAGMTLRLKANFTNTGASTVNVNGLGAKAITKVGTVALAGGEIQSGEVVEMTYDGTQFQLINPFGVIVLSAAPALVTSTTSTAQNNDTTFTTNFTPKVITIHYQISGTTSGTVKNSMGVAVFDGTTLRFNQELYKNVNNSTAVTQATTNISANAPTAGTLVSNDIRIDITVPTVTGTTFIVRPATTITGSPGTSASWTYSVTATQ